MVVQADPGTALQKSRACQHQEVRAFRWQKQPYRGQSDVARVESGQKCRSRAVSAGPIRACQHWDPNFWSLSLDYGRANARLRHTRNHRTRKAAAGVRTTIPTAPATHVGGRAARLPPGWGGGWHDYEVDYVTMSIFYLFYGCNQIGLSFRDRCFRSCHAGRAPS